MDNLDPFEPGTHVFTGTIKRCDESYAEMLTDSGFAVPLATHGGPSVRAGAHVTVVTRKYRPCYFVIALGKA